MRDNELSAKLDEIYKNLQKIMPEGCDFVLVVDRSDGEYSFLTKHHKLCISDFLKYCIEIVEKQEKLEDIRKQQYLEGKVQ